MNEQLPAEKQTRNVTPLDIANAMRRRKPIEADQTPVQVTAEAGDIVEHDGKQEMFIPLYYFSKKVVDDSLVDVRIPYSYRQFYSHSFVDEATGRTIPAPGWDSRHRLMDEDVALRTHGRTFTSEELVDLPNNLPSDDALFLRPLNSYEVDDYLETPEAL